MQAKAFVVTGASGPMDMVVEEEDNAVEEQVEEGKVVATDTNNHQQRADANMAEESAEMDEPEFSQDGVSESATKALADMNDATAASGGGSSAEEEESDGPSAKSAEDLINRFEAAASADVDNVAGEEEDEDRVDSATDDSKTDAEQEQRGEKEDDLKMASTGLVDAL